MHDTNTCDKCKTIIATNELIWITADDFRPLNNEKLPKDAYKKYDALCEPCYLSILIQGGHKTDGCACPDCSSIS